MAAASPANEPTEFGTVRGTSIAPRQAVGPADVEVEIKQSRFIDVEHRQPEGPVLEQPTGAVDLLLVRTGRTGFLGQPSRDAGRPVLPLTSSIWPSLRTSSPWEASCMSTAGSHGPHNDLV